MQHRTDTQKQFKNWFYLVQAKNKSLRTALHYAAQSGHTEKVQELVRLGANVEVKDKYNMTPREYAAKGGF
jgi:ankyrin repeat protein